MKNTLVVVAALAVGLAAAAQASDPASKVDAPSGINAPTTTVKARRATRIRIEVFERGAPAATITVPMWLVKGASKMLPKTVEEHVSIDQIIALAEDPPANGVLLDIEDHQGKDRVVISIVGD